LAMLLHPVSVLPIPSGGNRLALIQCRASVSMADWKQITARIRRARTSKDPSAQLSSLYEKTKDAMVAFELARFFEAATQLPEAAKWYGEAAKHFRRADWKIKAQEAATRLGGAPPTSDEPAADSASPAHPAAPLPVPEPGLPFEQNVAVFRSVVESGAESDVESDTESESAEASANATSADQSAPANEKPADAMKRRRRGRRGGRNRRKPGAASSTVTPRRTSSHAPSASAGVENETDSVPERSSFSLSPLPVETLPDGGGIALRGRYGDPGLSSRISLLEMQFRRLLTCAPLGVDSADRAPAGPGVLLLTDTDLTTYYYVESCQTLRIAVANLLRGGSSRRGGDSIKPQLAQHLGITDARVSKYLADHCVVRWLQLDEGASHFAHFVTAILRPVLND
jgi:hypothetical protein